MPKIAKHGKKPKDSKNTYTNDQLWITPSFSLKQSMRQSDWKLNRVEPPPGSKFLELADFALGLKPEKHKRKRTA
jgi:hypothetical protein